MTTTLRSIGDELALILDRETLYCSGSTGKPRWKSPSTNAGFTSGPSRRPSGTRHALRIENDGDPRRDLPEARPVTPIFLDLDDVLDIHDLHLRRYGGLGGHSGFGSWNRPYAGEGEFRRVISPRRTSS